MGIKTPRVANLRKSQGLGKKEIGEKKHWEWQQPRLKHMNLHPLLSADTKFWLFLGVKGGLF